MATQCPKCSNPIRPGGKFCGSCGHMLEAAAPAPPPATPPSAAPVTPPPAEPVTLGKSAAPTPQPTPAPDEKTCPHCGQPVREGVKFCASCGKSITDVPLAPTPKHTPPPPPPPSTPEIQRKPRIVLIGFLLGVILLICVSLVGIAWGLGLTDMLFPTPTPTLIP